MTTTRPTTIIFYTLSIPHQAKHFHFNLKPSAVVVDVLLLAFLQMQFMMVIKHQFVVGGAQSLVRVRKTKKCIC